MSGSWLPRGEARSCDKLRHFVTEEEQLLAAIAAIGAQRAILGDAVVEAALAPMREKLSALKAPAEVTEQRRQVTVLFADLSGFTAMAETMDPEELRDLVDKLWTHLDAVISAHGGLIDKHIGDAVMALWGARALREDDPEQAVRAALAMQDELAKLRSSLSGVGELQMRIGVNTGLVWLGAVGAKGEFTAMGDTVNLASRLEHAASVGTVLISHDTYRHIRGMFSVQALEPLQVKGKAECIQTYRVNHVRTRAQQLRNRGIEGVETPLVGRADDLQRVKDAYRAACTGELSGLILAGDPGMGKSRLVTEFRQWLGLEAQHVGVRAVRTFVGLSSEQARGRPFGVVRDLFAFEFAILETDSADVAREKFQAGFIDALRADPDAIMKAQFLGHLLGFDFAQSPVLRSVLGQAQQIRDRAFQYLLDFFSAITRGGAEGAQPAVVILEDAHWADSGTLDAFDHIFEMCTALPLFVLCPTRGSLFERRPNFGRPEWRHALQPLTEDETRLLVDQILRKAAEIPPDLRELIVEGAEGIPFYVEELIKVLIDEKVILPGEPHWRIAAERLPQVKVPPTLVGILQVRLDGLREQERTVLQRGSVAGRDFSEAMVAKLHGDNEQPLPLAEVSACLQDLVARELIFRKEPNPKGDSGYYRFKHALQRDVTYDTILLKHRKSLHAQVAQWLISRSADGVHEHPGLVASHFELAGERAEAAQWYGRAGRQAQAASAPAAAIGFYEKALSLRETGPLADERERLALYAGLGEVCWQQASFAEAAEAYAKMGTVAEALGDPIEQARAWNGRASAEQRRGDATKALQYAERAQSLAERAGAEEERARALVRKGMAHWALGELKKTQDLAEEALQISSRQLDQRGVADSLRLLGIAHDIQGRPSEAAACFERAKCIYQELGDQQLVAGMLNNLGTSAEIDGDFRRAVDCFLEAFTLAHGMGFRVGATQFLSNLGGGRVRLGEHELAHKELLQAIAMVEARGSAVFLPETYSYLAEACLGLGKLDEGEQAARKALELARAAQHQEFSGVALRVLGAVTAAKERAGALCSPESAVYFRESLEEFQKLGMDAARARTLRTWADALRKAGEAGASAELWRQARAIFERLGLKRELEWTIASEAGWTRSLRP